jgi:hypothetical protein
MVDGLIGPFTQSVVTLPVGLEADGLALILQDQFHVAARGTERLPKTGPGWSMPDSGLRIIPRIPADDDLASIE